jgi:hypothetical protein
MLEVEQQHVILALHRGFSESLLEIQKHGDAILQSLIQYKDKKAVKTEPLKTIYKTIRETCAPDGSLSNVKHRLDGLLFFQIGQYMEESILWEVYYKRSVWLNSYNDPAPKPIFDTCDTLTEPDIAYLCNFCSLYQGCIKRILEQVLNHCADKEPLYTYRHTHTVLLKIIKEQEQTIQKLLEMLTQHMNAPS